MEVGEYIHEIDYHVTSPSTLTVAVSSIRKFRVLQLTVDQSSLKISSSTSSVLDEDIIRGLRIIPLHDNSYRVLTAVGKISLNVHLYKPSFIIRVGKTTAELSNGDFGICYSAGFHVTSGQFRVAWGTVTNKIVLWPIMGVEDGSGEDRVIRSSECVVITGHVGVIFAVKLTSRSNAVGGGDTICSCSDDRSVRLFTREGGSEKERWANTWTGWGHTSRVWDVDFFPTSASSNLLPRVASSGEDGIVCIWTPSTDSLKILRGHVSGRSVWCCGVSDDGAFVASGACDGSGKIFRVDRDVTCENGMNNRRESIADGGVIMGIDVRTSENGEICCCNTAGRIFQRLGEEWSEKAAPPVSNPPKATAFAASGKFFVGNNQGCIKRSTKRTQNFFSPPEGSNFFAVQNLIVLPSGRSFATYIKGVVVELGLMGFERNKRSNENAVINCLATISEGKFLVGGDSRGNIFVWSPDFESPTQVLKAVHGRDHVRDLLFVENSNTLISAGHDGCLAMFDVSDEGLTMINRRNLTNTMSVIEAVYLSSNNAIVAAGYRASTFVVWDVLNGYEIASIDGE